MERLAGDDHLGHVFETRNRIAGRTFGGVEQLRAAKAAGLEEMQPQGLFHRTEHAVEKHIGEDLRIDIFFPGGFAAGWMNFDCTLAPWHGFPDP